MSTFGPILFFLFLNGLMGKELEEQIYIGSSSFDVITILDDCLDLISC